MVPKLRIKYIGFDSGYPDFKNSDIVTRFFKEGDVVVEEIQDANALIVGNYIEPQEMQQIIGFKNLIVLYVAEPILKFQFGYYAGQIYKHKKYHYVFGCVNNRPFSSVKFPLYYTSFKHSSDVFENVNNYVKSCDPTKKLFATLISRHDPIKIRKVIFQLMNSFGHISCPGRLFNNCSNDVVNLIGNPAWIKQFVFNICPENFGASHLGYITEKLMNACLGGAIPIYFGELDNLDERIFNRKRILFVNPNNLMELYDVVRQLMSNSSKLIDFYRQDVFMPGAHDVMAIEMHGAMAGMMDEIRGKLS